MSSGVFRETGPSAGPVLVSVPHAGREYAPWLPLLRLDVEQLRPLEDALVDQLAPEDVHAIIAHVPRAAIDLNREETDLDPKLVSGGAGPPAPSPRARSGLGLIPSRLGGQPIWRRALSPADVGHRIATIHRPWHAAIAAALAEKRRRWGVAVLVDLHSMPTLPGQADVVLGDRYGRTASEDLVALAEAIVARQGASVVRNTPYAGGAITARYGCPASGIHALQIEIDRRLYLDAAGTQPGPGLADMRSMVAALCRAAADWAVARAWPAAAE